MDFEDTVEAKLEESVPLKEQYQAMIQSLPGETEDIIRELVSKFQYLEDPTVDIGIRHICSTLAREGMAVDQSEIRHGFCAN